MKIEKMAFTSELELEFARIRIRISFRWVRCEKWKVEEAWIWKIKESIMWKLIVIQQVNKF